MMAIDLAMALDPVLLAERTGLLPDPWQAELLRSDARQIIMLASRQSGKTSVSVLLALHEALYHPPSLVLVLSPSLRQSQEAFRKWKDAYAALETVEGLAVDLVEDESALRVELANGSRVIALPGTERTVRGYSGVSLLICDEASRVDDALYHAIRPMTAVSGGRVVLLSTPWGQRGFFWREWSEGTDWHRFKVTANDVPRIPAAFLEQERRSLGELAYRQEYLVEFVDVESSVFNSDDVMAALTSGLPPLLAVPWP